MTFFCDEACMQISVNFANFTTFYLVTTFANLNICHLLHSILYESSTCDVVLAFVFVIFLMCHFGCYFFVQR